MSSQRSRNVGSNGDHRADRREEVATIWRPLDSDELVLERFCEEIFPASQRDDWFAGEEVEAEERGADRSSDHRVGREREVQYDQRGGIDQRASTRSTADTGILRR